MSHKYIPFNDPTNDSGVPVLLTEDGYKFYWVEGVWVDNLNPCLVDMTLDAKPPERQMSADDLYQAIIALCQQYGFTTEHSYDLAHSLVESIRVDETEEDKT
jgi:hypothetical protein